MLGESVFHLGPGPHSGYKRGSPEWVKGENDMFERTFGENFKTMTVGIGLSVAVIGTALAVAFW